MKSRTVYRDLLNTPWGWVGALWTEGGLRRMVLPRKRKSDVGKILEKGGGAAAVERRWTEWRKQVTAYLSGRRRCFDLPLDLQEDGEFIEAVRAVVEAIPYGETMTYGEVAAAAGRPRAARAVGNVMNRNPVPLLVPCHRVVAVSGRGGFASGPELKGKLLDLEAKGG
ncbi:methylated-DNA--[protein]-cysteine S-methyltransferase [Candidatus Moduliflexota bacterium]